MERCRKEKVTGKQKILITFYAAEGTGNCGFVSKILHYFVLLLPGDDRFVVTGRRSVTPDGPAMV